MDTNLTMRFLSEIIEDYENNGSGKDLREWLTEAVKRHIIGVDDEKASEIAGDMLIGIETYEKASQLPDPLDGIKDKITDDDRKAIGLSASEIAEAAAKNIDETKKEVENGNK